LLVVFLISELFRYQSQTIANAIIYTETTGLLETIEYAVLQFWCRAAGKT